MTIIRYDIKGIFFHPPIIRERCVTHAQQVATVRWVRASKERERLHVVTCSDLLTLKAYTCWRWEDDEDADLSDFIKMKLIKLIYCVPFRNFSFHILKVISLLEPSWWFEQSNIKYQAKPLRHFWKEDWDRWSTDYPKIWVVCFSWKLSQFKVIFLWISRSWFTFSTLLTFARPWLHLWI